MKNAEKTAALLQILLMPLLKGVFEQIGLADIAVRILRCGRMAGEPFFVFHYEAGPIGQGGGGGLAYILAVETAMAVSLTVHFFLKKNRLYEPGRRASWFITWYMLGYVLISVVGAALQGFYREPLYRFMKNNLGTVGLIGADIITMVIYCGVSYWVFFPIFKVIFQEKTETAAI